MRKSPTESFEAELFCSGGEKTATLQWLKPVKGIGIMRHKYTALKTVFEPSEESGFTVYLPSLHGCISKRDALGRERLRILKRRWGFI